MPLFLHNTEVHPLFVASPCQRFDIYFLGQPSFLLGEYNLVFFIIYPLRHKTYTKPLYFHKSKRNISYSQRTQQKKSARILKPIVKMSIQALRGFVIRAPNRICTGICDSRTAKKYLIAVRLGLRPTYGQWKRYSLRRRKRSV